MKRFRFIYWLFTGLLCVFLLGAFFGGTLFDNSAKASTLPTKTWQGATLPDWDQISFSTISGIRKGGVFNAPATIVQQLGYDPSRIWQAGETPDFYSKLGDFEETFDLQVLNLAQIAANVGNNLNAISLAAIELIEAQTLASLVAADPQLQDFQLIEVPPVFDLLQSHGAPIDPSATIGSVLENSPDLADLLFETLDLQQYSLSDLPGIKQVPLYKFRDWRNTLIQGIPGLRDLPFSQFPSPPTAVGTTVGTVDIAFGTAEQNRNRTISGSTEAGFSVPCKTNCAHVELAGNANVLGRQWISGKYQEVKGGFGLLGGINGGVEPTGRHPFGKAFKVVVWDVSEPEGKVDTALFFRVCKRGFPDLGCSPYFIGPIGWFSYSEGGSDVMFLGALDTKNSSTGVSQPTLATSPLIPNPEIPQNFLGDFSDLLQINGVDLNNLAHSISSIEGNYDSIGAYTCVQSNCGNGLGAFQLMSYRSDVQSLITAKPGGEEFLSKLTQENPQISSSQLLYYFPPDEQEYLFRADLSNLIQSANTEIDPTTGIPFREDRLIERVAQKHFGGSGVAIDSRVSDIHGRLSIKDYGKEVVSTYHSLEY